MADSWSAARQVRQFTPDARWRQRAGIQAPEGSKGKSAAQAAALFGIGTRLAELALTVLKRGVPELVQAVENGKITVTTAAKLAKIPADTQRHVVAEIVAGTPAVRALIATGVEKREPLCFDDKTLTQAVAHLRKLLDLRAAAFGPCDAYRQTREQLDLASRALTRWRTERLNEPMPLIIDAYGRRVPLKVVPAFQAAAEIKILCCQLDAIVRQIEGLSRRAGGDLTRPQFVLPRLHEVRKAL